MTDDEERRVGAALASRLHWSMLRQPEADARWAQRFIDGWVLDDAAIIAFLRGKENTWSQDEGFALVLLVDKERPGWQEHVVSAEHAALFELLAVE